MLQDKTEEIVKTARKEVKHDKLWPWKGSMNK